MVKQDLQNSDYRIRKLIGVLGFCLPIILIVSEGKLLASISHYYYFNLSALFFIIILSSFALFLISYKGYKIDTTTEMLSDDLVTNIGGFAALIVVFIPTRCVDGADVVLDNICENASYHLFGHNDKLKGIIHLVSAGIFIFSMGWMSKYKFTRNPDDKNNTLYRMCGNIVFVSIGVLLVLFFIEGKVSFYLEKYYVFIFETIAVIAFGVSWLVKGKMINDVMTMFEK